LNYILITIIHSTLNTIDRTYVSNLEIDKHALLNRGSPTFQYGFWRLSIVYLLMQHKFFYVNIIGRSWRTCKMNQITPTYLKQGMKQIVHDHG
jgi:hypothetical protein